MYIIVPYHVANAINTALDKEFKAMGSIEADKAAKEREHLYNALLDHYNEHGKIPEFKIVKRP